MSFVETIALGIIRGFLNNAIGKFTPVELQGAINENRDLWTVTPGWMKGQGHFWKNQYADWFNKDFDKKVNTELMLLWLEKDQPRLHHILTMNPLNHQWFDTQVKRVKEEIKRL